MARPRPTVPKPGQRTPPRHRRRGDTDPDPRSTSPRTGTTAGAGGHLRPLLLLRANLASLLDRDQTPARLLTTSLGGHVRVTADTARRLIDERGADLRTVIIDDHGSIVGVGRRRRVPPGWLRETLAAVHDTGTAPGCDAAARGSDIDHALPWFPARPGDRLGRTDGDELGPLCRPDNRGKERDSWRAAQLADGSRRWTHERSGLATRTLPATWRPPPRSEPDHPASGP